MNHDMTETRDDEKTQDVTFTITTEPEFLLEEISRHSFMFRGSGATLEVDVLPEDVAYTADNNGVEAFIVKKAEQKGPHGPVNQTYEINLSEVAAHQVQTTVNRKRNPAYKTPVPTKSSAPTAILGGAPR